MSSVGGERRSRCPHRSAGIVVLDEHPGQTPPGGWGGAPAFSWRCWWMAAVRRRWWGPVGSRRGAVTARSWLAVAAGALA